ncbi:unnamed protein product [Nyctereutes procyonoides]|uniref:(raccoon dog) hypothetical protein n=1 Tax=Nyctereutes procyonoides TaxID=34880 RepID=A0A811Y116_NYCPR|nr:unnamed protein product [Nyctereutes procyonoides]
MAEGVAGTPPKTTVRPLGRREGGVGGGGHHKPIHRLPLGSRPGSLSFLFSFLPPLLICCWRRRQQLLHWRRGRDPGGSSERGWEGERGREEGGGIFGPDLSAAAPRSLPIGCRRGHAESPIGQAVSVEGPPCAHSPAGFKARVGWAGSGMRCADWSEGGRLGWGRRELAADWAGLVKALSADGLSSRRRVGQRRDSGPAIGRPGELGRGVRGRRRGKAGGAPPLLEPGAGHDGTPPGRGGAVLGLRLGKAPSLGGAFTHRKRERGRDTGRGRSRLHAPGARQSWTLSICLQNLHRQTHDKNNEIALKKKSQKINIRGTWWLS